MRKPIIGIVAKNEDVEGDDGEWLFQRTSSQVRYDILDQGGIAIGILPTNRTLKFYDDVISQKYCFVYFCTKFYHLISIFKKATHADLLKGIN